MSQSGPEGGDRATTAAAAQPDSLGDRLLGPLKRFTGLPAALTWGVNLPSFFEGLVYFGTLTVLPKFLSENIGLGDVVAGPMMGLFTGGVTGAMVVLGGLGDRWGVRRALLFAALCLFIGRFILALGGTLHLRPGIWGPLHLTTLAGIAFIIAGYGAFQPTLYCAVKRYTSEKTAALGYGLIYAFQNLGAFTSGLLSPQLRHISEQALPPNGISGVLWAYAGLTALCGLTIFVGTRQAKSAVSAEEIVARSLGEARKVVSSERLAQSPGRLRRWLAEHPLADAKFSFFIFIVVPVQTLFAHGWLTLPLYIERAYRATPWVSRNFEFFANFNPVLIFLLTPLVAALTPRANVYKMMIIGTAVMALPTLLLTFGPHPTLLLLFLVIMAFGEALWQPRFLQFIAEMAPPGKTGLYMGVGQFPWFLTKMLTSLYSGWFLARYCPATGPQNSEFMWGVYAVIACISPLGLIAARRWASHGLPGQPSLAAQK